MNIFLFKALTCHRKKKKNIKERETQSMERGWRDTNQVKKSFALNGCGSRGRERTILNRTCVRNLEVNEEEIKEWENEKRNQGEKKCQDQIRKDWGIMWTTDNKTTRLKRGFRRNKRREGEKIQTIVKTYTQNKEAKEDEKKQWHGKCKERKKSIKNTLAERINLVSQKDEMWSHQESILALQKIFPNTMQFP